MLSQLRIPDLSHRRCVDPKIPVGVFSTVSRPSNVRDVAGETPSTLRFADRRRHGRVEVTDRDGVAVAFIDRALIGRRSTAFAADGSVLCRIRRRHPLSRYLDLLAGDGSRLGHLKESRKHHQVELCDGRRLRTSVRWFAHGWVLTDEAGAEVLSSVRYAVRDRTREQLESGRQPERSPSIRGYRFHIETFIAVGPDDWLVTPDGSLDLAQTVAVVEAYRILVKAARNRHASG